MARGLSQSEQRLERDELIFFPLLYWPVTDAAPPPSPAAVGRINRYLDTGGTILFDTRDGDAGATGPFGGAALAAERLRVAKAYLDCKARHGALADRVK